MYLLFSDTAMADTPWVGPVNAPCARPQTGQRVHRLSKTHNWGKAWGRKLNVIYFSTLNFPKRIWRII